MTDPIGTEDAQPASAKTYLDMIRAAEKAFSTYQTKCDSIDKKYASLKDMADGAGDREFQIFWANLEVLKPTIYSRAPMPVVVPRHKDSKELPRKASQMLERVLAYDAEADDLHSTLIQVRDDLALSARGVAWVLDNGQCIHVDRADFVHEPARKWGEVGWVARRAYMTREAVRERFPDADQTKMKFDEAKAKSDSMTDYKGTGKKAQVWEVWSKSESAVIWVTEGLDQPLDMQPPLVDVAGFFPCPPPAYGTLERRTLKPVPDFVYYRDQVDEINELTARISSLSESLRLKGFYASGVSEIGEAIEAAMRSTDNKAILVPISNLGALGGQGLASSIIWLPVADVAGVITSLVALRKQLVEDVYEITGLSDIMRGSSDASETATAQNLKSQYGSVRVRERQGEMVRIARDIFRIKAEIYAENVPAAELAQMAQMDIPTQEAAQQSLMAAQQQGQQVDPNKIVTLEQIDGLLKSQKIRPFVLDVESDSTIAANEEAEKKSRVEFITAMGGFIQQAGAMVQQQPQTAPFAAELMKFAAGAFRAGRELGAAIDEFAEQVKAVAAKAGQPQGPSPQEQQAQADAQAKAQAVQADIQIRQQKMQADIAGMQADHDLKTAQAQQAAGKTAAEIDHLRAQTAQILASMAVVQPPADVPAFGELQ